MGNLLFDSVDGFVCVLSLVGDKMYPQQQAGIGSTGYAVGSVLHSLFDLDRDINCRALPVWCLTTNSKGIKRTHEYSDGVG